MDIKLYKNDTHISDAKIYELHHILASQIVKFFRKYGMPGSLDRIEFAIDNVADSVEFGGLSAGSDSCLNFIAADSTVLATSI